MNSRPFGPLTSPVLLVNLQELVNLGAAVIDVFEEVELLLFPVRPNDQSIEQNPFAELNVLDCTSLNLMIAQAKHSLCHKHQTVVIDLKITNRVPQPFDASSRRAANEES